MDVVVRRDKQGLPRPGDEEFLKENLGQVKHGNQGQQASELEHSVDVLSQLGIEALLQKCQENDCELCKL